MRRDPGVVALDHERDLPQAPHVGDLAVEHLDLPPVEVGVALVHLEEVGGPEVALLAALAAADLDDHVLAVVGVTRDQQLAQTGLVPGQLAFLFGQLGVEVVAHLGVGLAGEHLAGVGQLRFRRCGTGGRRRRPA